MVNTSHAFEPPPGRKDITKVCSICQKKVTILYIMFLYIPSQFDIIFGGCMGVEYCVCVNV